MFTRAPGPESGFESGSQSTWERWSESGFESSLPPCKHNQSGSGSGSESLCKRGFIVASLYNAAQPECPSSTVIPLYADFEMKELVEGQACVVIPSAAGDQRNTMHAEPNSAKTCDWVGQLGQVDHRLRLAHRGDKDYPRSS